MNRESRIRLESLQESDHEAVARLLHRSLVHWYESRLRQGARFGECHEPFILIPQVYAELDPGEGVIARDPVTHELLGVGFVHPRPTHVSVGIVATSPAARGRGVARALLEPVLARAAKARLPVRLVSSALNLDSFSLYTRLGFVPHTWYQDLSITVPAGGLRGNPPDGAQRVRLARTDEAPRLASFEQSLEGVSREKDYQFFLSGRTGSWRTWVLENEGGALAGILVASTHPSHLMLGPGVALDDTAAIALLWTALNAMRDQSLVFLIPCLATNLVRAAYGWGARNVELHVAQAFGPRFPARGIVFPTFLPESA